MRKRYVSFATHTVLCSACILIDDAHNRAIGALGKPSAWLLGGTVTSRHALSTSVAAKKNKQHFFRPQPPRW